MLAPQTFQSVANTCNISKLCQHLHHEKTPKSYGKYEAVRDRELLECPRRVFSDLEEDEVKHLKALVTSQSFQSKGSPS